MTFQTIVKSGSEVIFLSNLAVQGRDQIIPFLSNFVFQIENLLTCRFSLPISEVVP
jgi:hypothetical protein